MDELRFNKELNKLAPDLRLLWQPEKHLWGIFQVRSPHILVMDADVTVRPWLLFDIIGDDGMARLPDQRDLSRVLLSVKGFDYMQTKGADSYMDALEESENNKKEAAHARTDDLFHQAAKEVTKTAKHISNRRLGMSRHGKWELNQ